MWERETSPALGSGKDFRGVGLRWAAGHTSCFSSVGGESGHVLPFNPPPPCSQRQRTKGHKNVHGLDPVIPLGGRGIEEMIPRQKEQYSLQMLF